MEFALPHDQDLLAIVAIVDEMVNIIIIIEKAIKSYVR